MLKRFAIISLIAMLTMSFHEYYFSFGEIEYNEELNRFEIAITCTGHDLEKYIQDKGIEIPILEECVDSPIHKKKLEKIIQDGFTITINNKSILLELVGMEVNVKDQAVFYLSSRKLEKPDSFTVEYNLMMDYYPIQQNKLTVFTTDNKEYLTFLKSRTKRKFEY